MKKIIILLLFLPLVMNVEAQTEVQYQKPPKEILDLVDVSLAPIVRMDSKAEYMILLYRDPYKSIQELSEKELRLGGLRINPKTNISSRARYYKSLSVKKVKGGKEIKIKGLPNDARLANFTFSPNEEKMAFTNTTTQGVELWILDIQTAKAQKITSDNLNANIGSPFLWFRDSEHLLLRVIPKDKQALIEEENSVPTGPTVSENTGGKKAQNRTYQDLLKNPNDEKNFEQLVRSELYKTDVKGNTSLWRKAGMYRSMSFSPDGMYMMLSEIEKPFSYLVPYSRFPYTVTIYDTDAKKVKEFLKVPLIEDLPKGFMASRKGPRNISWRSDKPSTLYWCEAQDEGDPQKEVSHRDIVYEIDAPFSGNKKELVKTINRFYSMTWGNDNMAIAYDYWWNSRNTKAYLYNPSNSKESPKVIYDRNYQDRYNDPGDFITEDNEYGRPVLVIDKNKIYLRGEGYSEKGKKPFIDQMEIKSFKKTRLWQANLDDQLENISSIINIKKGEILTRIESPNEYPNYYIRNIKKRIAAIPITNFENPFKSMDGVHKELIKYKRDDGLELSATLYLPPNYDKTKKEKLPMVMWAYPREYKDKSSAGQVTNDPNEFTYPYYGSPIYWVMRGYVVLDDASFPIVGEGDNEPNDSFRKQLVANGRAAIDAVDKLGYIDRNRVAVGGHSYGAFMTANLLSHSNDYAAGIARSGAYNRTLTPFGFQSEERNYWEAPGIYYDMSPFMHAEKMKTPLLLIHGEADNNSGTYPMQSQRYFNALKGLGATVRLVMLPKESHGYSAKESILHILWEQDQWLEKYVKNKGKE